MFSPAHCVRILYEILEPAQSSLPYYLHVNVTGLNSGRQLEPDIDRGRAFITIYSTLCGLSFVIIVLRLWSRLIIRAVGWDDILMVVTWVRLSTPEIYMV